MRAIHWLRALGCRLLRAVPAEDVPRLDLPESAELWGDLWTLRSVKTFWPRVTREKVWSEDLEPFFRQALLVTAARVMHETDPEQVRRSQERMKLLNEWLEAPIRMEQMTQMALQNALRVGNGALDREMARRAG